jgi:hypothetical protein
LCRSVLSGTPQDDQSGKRTVHHDAALGNWRGRVCLVGASTFCAALVGAALRYELMDTYAIRLSDDAIEKHLQRYRHMVAAWQQNLEVMRAEYRDVSVVLLTIDGLQPKKGHETLYVVRELTRKRVWFAEALLSSSAEEVREIRYLAARAVWAAPRQIPSRRE